MSTPGTLFRLPLTRTEAQHLLTLVEERIRDGSYYGVREHYYARNSRLKTKLEAFLEHNPAKESR